MAISFRHMRGTVKQGLDLTMATGKVLGRTTAGEGVVEELGIGTDIQEFIAAASQAEMEAGTETALRTMSPLRIAQAIAALVTVTETPVGVVSPYAGATAPTDWLLCYGQAVSRTTYADLFTAISTTYGVGDGATTFNLPDLRGRVVAGQDDMGGASANRLTDQSGGLDGDVLGDTGGSETHTLSEAELASHNHIAPRAFNSGDGSDYPYGSPGSLSTIGATVGDWEEDGANAAESTDLAGYTSTTGSDTAHNNVQPTIILNYIIKAL